MGTMYMVSIACAYISILGLVPPVGNYTNIVVYESLNQTLTQIHMESKLVTRLFFNGSGPDWVWVNEFLLPSVVIFYELGSGKKS